MGVSCFGDLDNFFFEVEVLGGLKGYVEGREIVLVFFWEVSKVFGRCELV